MTIDEGKLLSAVSTMNAAEQELRVVGSAFKKLHDEYFLAWKNTNPRDDKGREKLWVATTILTAVEKSLRSTIANGRVAQADLDRIRVSGE
jgi:hypothetical protein